MQDSDDEEDDDGIKQVFVYSCNNVVKHKNIHILNIFNISKREKLMASLMIIQLMTMMVRIVMHQMVLESVKKVMMKILMIVWKMKIMICLKKI